MQKVYCVMGQDPVAKWAKKLGHSWLIEVFGSKKEAEKFCENNKQNDNMLPYVDTNLCHTFYILEKEIKNDRSF